MPKMVRGSAGRIQRREEIMERYGANLAMMLLKQLKQPGDGRMMHLGTPGAIAFAQGVAPLLETGELVVVVFSYDDMEDARAALAGLGNVEVINELDDLDPDEPSYDTITCTVPYNRGHEYTARLLETALRLLSPTGTLLVGGDRQQDFERDIGFLRESGSTVTQVAQEGQLRLVSATKPTRGGGLRAR
jgi:16S rRNA G1207 methylase RsmC